MAEKKTGKGNSGTSKKKQKEKQQETLRFAIVIVAALILLIIIYMIQRYSKPSEAEPSKAPTPTSMVFDTPTPEAVPTEKADPTKAPTNAAVTDTPTPAPTETQAPAETATPTPEPTATQAALLISDADAQTTVEKSIDKALYKASLIDDHLNVDGVVYYEFEMSDKATGKKYSPFIVVSKNDGKMYYYDGTGVTAFTKFPLDTASTEDPDKVPVSGGITAAQAYKILCSMDKDDLLLAKNPSEYRAEYTNEIDLTIDGKDCYNIQLFETSNGKERLRGSFFISVDGLNCYYIDTDTELPVLVPIG